MCWRCKAESLKMNNAWSNRVRSAVRYPPPEPMVFIHAGGEHNCGCGLCYLRQQPRISFQVGWLAQAVRQ